MHLFMLSVIIEFSQQYFMKSILKKKKSMNKFSLGSRDTISISCFFFPLMVPKILNFFTITAVKVMFPFSVVYCFFHWTIFSLQSDTIWRKFSTWSSLDLTRWKHITIMIIGKMWVSKYYYIFSNPSFPSTAELTSFWNIIVKIMVQLHHPISESWEKGRDRICERKIGRDCVW